MNAYALIMAGGLGTRLWPLTSQELPKALLSFDDSGRSLLERTIDRISMNIPHDKIYIVADRQHKRRISSIVKTVPLENMIFEPFRRGTLSCVCFTALFVMERDPSAILIVLPGEQLITDIKRFNKLLTHAVNFACSFDSVVAFGVKPSSPETGFGYIKIGHKVSDDEVKVFWSEGFVEKPEKAKAEFFLSSGQYLWNSGIYVLSVSTLFSMTERFANDTYQKLMLIKELIKRSDQGEMIGKIYSQLNNISIDYAIMEKLGKFLVVLLDVDWNDMGTWTEVAETWNKDESSNSYLGNYLAFDSSGCIVYSPDKLTVLLGVKDIVVIDTSDGLLVCSKDRVDEIKLLMDKISTHQGTKR